jgi:anti-sigma regulatory factor (Ser/Thr protein kinase)
MLILDASAAPAGAPLRRCRLNLHASPAASSQARRTLHATFDGFDEPEVMDSVALVATELINNAVIHGIGEGSITLIIRQLPDTVEISVQNRGGRLRMKDIRRHRRQGGRGLDIVDALVDSSTRRLVDDRGAAGGNARDGQPDAPTRRFEARNSRRRIG